MDALAGFFPIIRRILVMCTGILLITSCGGEGQDAIGENSMHTIKTQLRVIDVDAAKTFYTNVFSMAVEDEWDEAGDRGVVLRHTDSRGEALLELYEVKEIHSFGGVSLQMRIPSAEQFVKSLPEGIEYEGPQERPWGSIYVYLKDPSGVDIIAYEEAGP